jgi:hypothetical protein
MRAIQAAERGGYEALRPSTFPSRSAKLVTPWCG